MTTRNALLKPVLKWVGGKRQLLDDILPLLPASPKLYVEPFLGGAAVLLAKQPSRSRQRLQRGAYQRI